MTVILRLCHGNSFFLVHRHNVLLTLLLEAAVMALRPATNIMCAHPVCQNGCTVSADPLGKPSTFFAT
jgi:hypothetical protein